MTEAVDFERIKAKIDGMDAAGLEDMAKHFAKHRMPWIPTVGPQMDAYFSKADELLYGGQGGGGKSDLALGLAFTAHTRSLILRRQYVDQGAMIDRAIEINGTRDGYSGSIPPRLRTKDGRTIIFGANKDPGDEESFQGQAFDLKVFDEAVQHLESQVKFHLGWVRSANSKQRTRVVLATNPPINALGDWIIGRYRPWLDVTHDNPAKPGELRWFITDPEGNDLEVEGPTPKEITYRGETDSYIPRSRTFIPAALRDNPFLINTGYQSQLDALPEPLRSAVRDGNFMATRVDAAYQVIPSEWVHLAQARWTKEGSRGIAMTAMAYDPAGGGRDTAELICRHGGWFAQPVTTKGAEVTDGSLTVALLFQHRRNGAVIVIDVGGGYAGQTALRLKDNNTEFTPFDGNGAGIGRDASGRLKFTNARSMAWWRFREALDPDQPGGSIIALPPNPALVADLTAPIYEVNKGGITIESKDAIRKRLGRSPGKGDVVVMSWSEGEALARKIMNGNGGGNVRSLPTQAKSTRKGALQRRRG